MYLLIFKNTILVVYNEKMYIFGGYNALVRSHYNDLYEFNIQTNEWKLVQPRGKTPCNRRRQACVLVGDRVFLFGGTRFDTHICQYI